LRRGAAVSKIISNYKDIKLLDKMQIFSNTLYDKLMLIKSNEIIIKAVILTKYY